MGGRRQGFYRAFIRHGAQGFYGQIHLQFIPRSDDSIRICKRGKILDSVLIRASTTGQLRITLGPWFCLPQRHGAVLKAGWRAADDSRWACGVVAARDATAMGRMGYNAKRKWARKPGQWAKRGSNIEKRKRNGAGQLEVLAENNCRFKKDLFLNLL
jgi:hypothetical protein